MTRRAIYACQKAMEGAKRMLQTLEKPSPVVDEAVRILEEGLTESQVKKVAK